MVISIVLNVILSGGMIFCLMYARIIRKDYKNPYVYLIRVKRKYAAWLRLKHGRKSIKAYSYRDFEEFIEYLFPPSEIIKAKEDDLEAIKYRYTKYRKNFSTKKFK